MNRSRSFHEELPVTAVLLLFNLAFFALEFIANTKVPGFRQGFIGDISGEALIKLGMLSPGVIESGEYWRLLSCTFLHGGLIHLVFNGLFLFDFGRLSEPLLSRWRYLTVYVASGLGASLSSFVYMTEGRRRVPFEFDVGSVGASGALCGLIGALFAFSVRHGQQHLRNALVRVIIWVAIISFLPFVDWAAHAGGFAVGFGFGWFTTAYTTSTAAARWRYPGYVAAALVIVSLLMALRNYYF